MTPQQELTGHTKNAHANPTSPKAAGLNGRTVVPVMYLAGVFIRWEAWQNEPKTSTVTEKWSTCVLQFFELCYCFFPVKHVSMNLADCSCSSNLQWQECSVFFLTFSLANLKIINLLQVPLTPPPQATARQLFLLTMAAGGTSEHKSIFWPQTGLWNGGKKSQLLGAELPTPISCLSEREGGPAVEAEDAGVTRTPKHTQRNPEVRCGTGPGLRQDCHHPPIYPQRTLGKNRRLAKVSCSLMITAEKIWTAPCSILTLKVP